MPEAHVEEVKNSEPHVLATHGLMLQVNKG